MLKNVNLIIVNGLSGKWMNKQRKKRGGDRNIALAFTLATSVMLKHKMYI